MRYSRYLAHGNTVEIKVSLVKEEENTTGLTATQCGSLLTSVAVYSRNYAANIANR